MISMAEPPAAGRSTVEHFELREPPFDPAPDSRFAHGTQPQARVLDIVASAVKRREGLVVVTGEEGAGKTTCCLGLAQRFGSRTFLSMVPAPPPDASRFVYGLLADFGLASSAGPQPELPGIEDLRTALERFLISLAPLQSHAVVVMDDAQRLSPPVIEEIFRLADFAENHPGLLQIVLVGAPSLVEILRRPASGHPNVQVSRRHRLPPLHDKEVREYIEHRLQVAQGVTKAPGTPIERDRVPRPRFSDAAVSVIARRSSGNPRKINAICDRALTLAAARSADSVSRRLAGRAAADLGWRRRFPALLPAPSSTAALAIVLLVAVAVVALSIHFAGATPALEGRPPVPLPASLAADQPYPAFQSEALERATMLSAEPNVRGLLKLQDEVHSWDSRTKFASHAAVEGLLLQLERLTDEARRRQLEEDRRLILEDSGKQ